MKFTKNPSTRNKSLRDLAQGEECSVCCGHYCQPETTVWAHTNTLSDNKGGAYKAHDHLGFFAGQRCHSMIDQGSIDWRIRETMVREGQERTRERLKEIARSLSVKPWKVRAAQWALAMLEEHRV
jgi:hypothetical protein